MLRQRLRDFFVAEPVFISLSMRWMGWLVALVIVLSKSAPEVNLKDANFILLVTFCQLAVMTGYPRYLRDKVFPQSWEARPFPWPVLNMLVALWAIHQTGGWDSPFYHYAVTVVLAPSLQFGLLGAFVSSGLFVTGYLIAIRFSEPGFSPAYISPGHPEPDLISTPLNPIMIGLYAAFLGELLQRVRQERDNAEKLAAAEERARMADDIHDGVSQTLFMLTMSLESGLVMAKKENAEATASHLESLTPVAQKALIELRNAMYSVEPLADGRQTLAQALTQLVRDYQSATGKEIALNIAKEFQEPKTERAEVFRIVQEALSNACQHSSADRITLKLGDPNAQSICLEDNGCGFDPESVSRGRGLNSLERRAHLARLAYKIESDDGGTTVKLDWSARERSEGEW